MNNFLTILKYSLINNLRINKIGKRFRKGILATAGVGVLFIYLFILAIVTLYMLMFVNILSQGGEPKAIFLLGITLSAFLVFFSTVPKANAYIFRSKDYDFLMTLPVKTKTIVATRLLTLYLAGFLFCFTIMTGIQIAYFISFKFDIVLCLLYFVLTIFVPMFPIAIGSLVSFILGYIPLKQKAKNILSTLFYLIFTIGFMFIYFQMMNTNVDNMDQQMSKIYTVFGKSYIIGQWAFNGLLGNYLELLLFVIVSIVPIICFILIVGKNFKKFNSLTNRAEVNKNYRFNNEKFQKSKSEVQTILNKELKLYISMPMYIMNTIIGPILSVVGTILVCINITGVVSIFGQNLDAMKMSNYCMLIVTIMLVFCVSMMSTSASTISLEGKSFWILKSAPIKTRSVLWGKLLLNLLMCLPFLVIDIIIAGVMIKPSFLYLVICLYIVVCFTLGMSFIGIFFNILFPRFEFDNPIKVIKQGISVLFTLLAGFIPTIILLVVGIILLKLVGVTFAILAAIIIGTIFALVSYILVFTVGVKKYERLNA